MSSLKAKIRLFRSMETLYKAGVSISKSLRQSHPHPFSKICAQIADRIESGQSTLGEGMRAFPRHFTTIECDAVVFGESTGRLEEVFVILADRLEKKSAHRSKLIKGLIYPAFLYHFAAILFPVILFFTSRTSILTVVLEISVAIGLPWLLVLIFGLCGGFGGSGPLQLIFPGGGVLIYCPIVGPAFVGTYLYRFLEHIGYAIKTGVPIIRATKSAAELITNPFIASRGDAIPDDLENNQTSFTEAVDKHLRPLYPNSHAWPIIETGEASGSLDKACLEAAEIIREAVEKRVSLILGAIPKIIYLAVVVCVAWFIIDFYLKRIQAITRNL